MHTLLDVPRSLWHWLVALPPDFAFLLSLPFLVALTAVLASLAQAPKKKPPGG